MSFPANASIDAMSNTDDAVKFFERKFIQVLNDPECQTSCTSLESVNDVSLRFHFSVDVPLQNFKDSHGWDEIYTNQ